MELDAVPEHLLVLGGGYVGVEVLLQTDAVRPESSNGTVQLTVRKRAHVFVRWP
jgi:hypothetical protein